MARGDHVFVKCNLAGIPYQHHGIDMGDSTVTHLAPASGARVAIRDESGEFTVRRDSMDVFSRGQTLSVVKHLEPLPVDSIIANAEKLLGKSGYSLLDGNCEHFASFCATGKSESRQVEISQHAAVSAGSLVTKAFWSISACISSRVVATTVSKSVVKGHPLVMIADGVELVTLAATCARGFSPEKSRMVARITGSITAAGVGTLVAGPAGAIASVALHNSSTAIAEQVCKRLRRFLS